MVNQTVGYLREKIGRTIHKAMIAQKVATIEQEVYKQEYITGINNKTGNPETIMRSVPVYIDPAAEKPQIKTVKKALYRIVKQAYFMPKETLLVFKERVFEFTPQSEAYTRGEVHVHFFDYETGDRLDMSGVTLAQKNPLDLGLAIDVSHIKQWKTGNLAVSGWIIPLLLFGLGICLGLIIGTNIPAINHIVNPGTTPPVQTVP